MRQLVVRLLWKLNKCNLPTNFILSKRRLNSLLNSLKKKDPGLIKKYNEQLLEQVNLAFIEKVGNLNLHEGILHYIPHLPVFRTDSATTKMQKVYDASARVSSEALSLNDCLNTGSNLMQDLTGILLKFTTHRIAFTVDIEKALLQIELNNRDRDATRFLWLKDSFVSKLFDPLGYVEPIIVRAKIMIQDLWKQNLSWDQEVPSKHRDQWLN
ncbi:uncharacterized protein [Montipora foliosa]|uniref:uncharacterized protein n=1 Tax=Montipora foliosa TaxID=591990 RepID=UPI0035F13F40